MNSTSQGLSLVALSLPLVILGALLLLGARVHGPVFGPAFVVSTAPLVVLTAS